MASIINLLLFLGLCYFANAQWRGDIGYQKQGRNWELRGGARYEINRGRTKGHFGGHGFINSNGQRGWGVSGGVSKTFAGGRGSYGVQGFRNSNGGYGARATFSYRWRGRRSLDDQIKKICAECVSIKIIDTQEKLQEYASLHKIDFAMIARFQNFYIDANQTVLHFKIKHVLETPPADVNITQAKVFNIFAERASCARICLKDVVRDDFMVTGAMFHGRLIIHDKLLLLHVLNKRNETEKAEKPAGDGTEDGPGNKEDEKDEEEEEDDDDNDKNNNKSETEDSNNTKAKLAGEQEEQAESENVEEEEAEGHRGGKKVP